MRNLTIVSMLALSSCSIHSDDRSFYELEDHNMIETCVTTLGEKGSKNFDFYNNYISSEYGTVSISRNSHSNYITLSFGRTTVESTEKSVISEHPTVVCIINVESKKVVKLDVPKGYRNRGIKNLVRPDQTDLDLEYKKLKNAAKDGEIATLSHKLYQYRDNNWVQVREEDLTTVPVKDML